MYNIVKHVTDVSYSFLFLNFVIRVIMRLYLHLVKQEVERHTLWKDINTNHRKRERHLQHSSSVERMKVLFQDR